MPTELAVSMLVSAAVWILHVTDVFPVGIWISVGILYFWAQTPLVPGFQLTWSLSSTRALGTCLNHLAQSCLIRDERRHDWLTLGIC